MAYLKNKLIILFFFLLTSCSSIPSNTSNSCSIFNERYLWYKHTKKVEKKWGTPIYIQLAIIKMESDFDWLAKPPRQKDHQAHSVTHKLLKEHGINIKKRLETN